MVTCLGVGQPGLNVLPGRAAGITRRQQVDVDRALLRTGPGARPPVQQIRQRRNVLSLWSQCHVHHATPGNLSSLGTLTLVFVSSPEPPPQRASGLMRRPVVRVGTDLDVQVVLSGGPGPQVAPFAQVPELAGLQHPVRLAADQHAPAVTERLIKMVGLNET